MRISYVYESPTTIKITLEVEQTFASSDYEVGNDNAGELDDPEEW